MPQPLVSDLFLDNCTNVNVVSVFDDVKKLTLLDVKMILWSKEVSLFCDYVQKDVFSSVTV
jgi:thioredoxin-related protein